MKRKGNTQESVKFFRICIPDSTNYDIDTPFILEDFLVKSLSRKVSVKSVSSGKIWRMEMTTNKKGKESNKVILKKGWKKIVEGEKLKETTVVVFEFDGEQVFQFSMYEVSSGCKKVRNEVETEVIEVESEEESDDLEEEEEEEVESRERVDSLRRRAKGDSLHLKSDERRYLDDYTNPSFKVDRTLKRSADLRIPAELRKDYNLEFSKFITLVDKMGKLKREVSVWKNRSVYVKKFGSVFRRNHLKESDELICELKTTNDGLVTQIKVHFING